MMHVSVYTITKKPNLDLPDPTTEVVEDVVYFETRNSIMPSMGHTAIYYEKSDSCGLVHLRDGDVVELSCKKVPQ